MENSPAGRCIVELTGDADAIRKRGQDIRDLGSQMISGASFLRRLADETSDQRGQAIDKLREIVGDTYEELRRAGEMYKPTGPVLISYAAALDESLPAVRNAVGACERAWSRYLAAPGFREGERPWYARPQDTDSDEAQDAADDDAAKERKYDTFVAQARLFDAAVDTWEDAFDAAADGISDVLDGKIKDGFWDNVDGYVGVAIEVLKYIGIAVAIAGIIIGGPIIAAIAAVASILTLALTIYQFARGDTGTTELVLAIVGVIPFGSAGKLFQNGKRLDFLGDMFKAFKPSTWTKSAAEVGMMKELFTAGGRGWGGAWKAFAGTYKANNPAGVGDAVTRFLLGKDTKTFTEITEAMVNGGTKVVKGAAAWEFGYQLLSGPWKMIDNIATWTGNGDAKPSKQLPIVGALL